jgi:diadenosine tetraphosphate (Ap4A) HIT family hydrolase
MQDGPAAGQTVPHVHIHVLPRYFEDISENDKIYDMIDAAETEEDDARRGGGDRGTPVGSRRRALVCVAASVARCVQA